MSSSRAGVIVCAGLLLVVAGCKSSTGGSMSGHPTHLYADPSFSPTKTVRLPIMGFVNTSTDADAVGFFTQYLEEALRTRPTYVVVSARAVERDARRLGMLDTYRQLNQQWRDNRAFLPSQLREFADAYQVDYVLGGELSEWLTQEVDREAEGYSHSDVEVTLSILSVATGEVVWQARDKMVLKSAPYSPRQLQGEADENTGIYRGQARVVPPAPPIEDAAKRTAENLVAALP